MATDQDSSAEITLFTLRRLPLPARVLIAAFLITVGMGYGSALVQLHMQHASPGALLPTPEDVVHAYHGHPGKSTFERLITASETLPFNGSGSMRAAFTFKSAGWPKRIRERAEKMNLDPQNQAHRQQAEQELRKEREREITAVVAWIQAGASKDNYAEFVLPDELAREVPEEQPFFGKNAMGQTVAQVENIIETRCVRCHNPGSSGAQGEIHLKEFDVVQDYLKPEQGGGLSLPKLAQSTHVHMLGFAMLYGLTGLIFSLTSYPCILRLLLAPFPMIMQVIDISCWWLARLPGDQGVTFAQIIPITGGLVGLGLFAHITLGALNLFGVKGKVVVLVLFLAGAALAGLLYGNVIAPYLAAE